MKPADRVAYCSEVAALVHDASTFRVQRALVAGLVAAHRPRPQIMQCLTRFSTSIKKLDGCSLCEPHGKPVSVEKRDWLPGSVWHVHLPRDAHCVSCDTRWPCEVATVIRDDSPTSTKEVGRNCDG